MRCKPSFSVTSAGDIASHTHQLLSQFSTRYRLTSRQILLISEHEQQALLHFSVAENPMKFLLGLVDTVTVLAVDNEDETLGTGVIMPPERTDLILPSNVPNIEFDVLVRDRLDVEPNCCQGGRRTRIR
jgi:hypothetical protein